MAYQAILRVYKGFSGGGWPRAWRGVRVADMGGRTTPLRSPYKPGQVPHSAHTRLKSQQAAFPLGEEVRVSRLGLKPAPRSPRKSGYRVNGKFNGHTAHKNELAATQGPCAIYLRELSRKVGALGTQPNVLFL